MKCKIVIYAGLTVIVAVLNWRSANNQVSAATRNVRFTERPLHLHTSNVFPVAKIICPPQKPCYDDGRGSVNSINIISPTRGSLLNNKPMLAWSGVPGAISYSVRIVRSRETIWERKVENTTEISYPADKAALDSDKDYDLIVETIVDNKEKSGSVRFRTISQVNAQKLQAEATAIANSQLTSDEKTLKIVKLYTDNDLFTEAIEILNASVKNGSQTISIYQNLGDLYFQVGLDNLAETSYKQALNLATSLNEINPQAEAQVGLGQVNIASENWEQAIDWLKAARTNYEKLKDPESLGQLAQFIAEVYDRSGNQAEAIRWYQQAKIEYEALLDTQRLNYVEEKLRTLKP